MMKASRLLAGWFLAALSLTPHLLIAGEVLLSKSEMSSRFGQLKVFERLDEKVLFIGKKQLPLSDHSVDIAGKWQLGVKDVFLVSMSSGGNFCPATYAFVSVESKLVSVTEAFGNCSDLPEVKRLGTRILVKFGRMSRSQPAVVVEFDDGAVFEGRKRVAVTTLAF
jgi:hypothetical protein